MIVLRLEKGKEPESWKKLHVGGIEGIRSQHVKVLMNKLPQKHPEWQEDRHPMLRHGSVVRPTMYLASMDIQTAFGDVRMRGEPVLIQSMSPPRKHGSSQIAVEDCHATTRKRGRKFV